MQPTGNDFQKLCEDHKIPQILISVVEGGKGELNFKLQTTANEIKHQNKAIT